MMGNYSSEALHQLSDCRDDVAVSLNQATVEHPLQVGVQMLFELVQLHGRFLLAPERRLLGSALPAIFELVSRFGTRAAWDYSAAACRAENRKSGTRPVQGSTARYRPASHEPSALLQGNAI